MSSVREPFRMRAMPDRHELARAQRRGRRWALLLSGAIAVMAWAGARATPPDLVDRIADVLVVPAEDRFVAHCWVRPPDIVALYYGADWCGPCHAFVPELARTHAALRAAGVDTDVVYVSRDESEQDMRRYMRLQRMPWPAVDYRRLPAMHALRQLGGPAPPNLVLIDRDGDIIANAWDGRRYLGLQPVLRAWIDAAAALPRSSSLPTTVLPTEGAPP